MKLEILSFLKFMRQRVFETGIMLFVFMFGFFSIVQGHCGIGIGFLAVAVVVLVFLFWYDTIGAEKLTAQRKTKDLERVKNLFSLKEGELVEVLFIPTSKEFTMRMSLNIQQTMKTRYFAVLQGKEISIIAKIGDVMTEPEKMNNPLTLEYQFIGLWTKKKINL